MVENVCTISDVISFFKQDDAPHIKKYELSFLMSLAERLGPQVLIEKVDTDSIYERLVNRNTLLSYRHRWRRLARLASPECKTMRYPYKNFGVQNKPTARQSNLSDGYMRIPIPLPEKGITVYVNAPIALTKWDVERVKGVLMAYAK